MEMSNLHNKMWKQPHIKIRYKQKSSPLLRELLCLLLNIAHNAISLG